MSDMHRETPQRDIPKITPHLAGAVRRVRVEDAEHSEVLAELRSAENARLEMMKEALKPILAQVPEEIDLFDTGLVPGEHPRLFIDMLAYIEMARDRRSYRFLQDTRHGRVTLAESETIDGMLEAVTDYIARRMVEREKALVSDQTVEDAARRLVANAAPKAAVTEAPIAPLMTSPAPRRRSFFVGALIAFVNTLGVLAVLFLLGIGAWVVWALASPLVMAALDQVNR